MGPATKRVLSLAVFGLFMAPPSIADEAEVVRECTRGGDVAAVEVYLNDVRAGGASTSAIDQSVADLTVALGEAALATTSQPLRKAIAACIRSAAAAVSNDQQRAQIEGIALAVENQLDGPYEAVSASGA